MTSKDRKIARSEEHRLRLISLLLSEGIDEAEQWAEIYLKVSKIKARAHYRDNIDYYRERDFKKR